MNDTTEPTSTQTSAAGEHPLLTEHRNLERHVARLLSDVEQRLYDVAHKGAPPLAAVRNAVSEAMSRKTMVYAAYPGVLPGSL